LSVERD